MYFLILKEILIQISLKFVLKGPIDSKSAKIMLMTWHQANTWTSDDLNGFYIRHQASRS